MGLYQDYKIQGFGLVGVMISVSVVALLLRLAIPNLLRERMTSNQATARATLKTISTALETYTSDKDIGYPTDISVLLSGNPAYLNNNYLLESPIEGYNYGCDFLEVSGYDCSATPEHCNKSGSKIYTVTTGGAFKERNCSE